MGVQGTQSLWYFKGQLQNGGGRWNDLNFGKFHYRKNGMIVVVAAHAEVLSGKVICYHQIVKNY